MSQTTRCIDLLLIGGVAADAAVIRDCLGEPRESRFRLTHTKTLNDATNRVEKQSFDAILLALSLTHREGREAITRMCTLVPDVPTIILAERENQALAMRAAGEGAQAYLVKDELDTGALVRSIHYSIEHKRNERELQHQKALFEAIFDSVPDAMLLTDMSSRVLMCNPGFSNIFGYAPDEVTGEKTTRLHASKAESKRALKRRDEAELAVSKKAHIFNYKRKNGDLFPGETVVTIIKAPGDNALAHLSVIRDVTEREHTDRALQSSEERFRALYDENPGMLLTVDPDGTLLSVNKFGAELLGYEVDDLVGINAATLQCKGEKTELRRYLDACMECPDTVCRWESCNVRKDGSEIWVKATARVVVDRAGKTTILVLCEDITETHALSAQLKYQAGHDALTGLVNRQEFEHRLRRVLETAPTDKSDHALCYLDLDQFKVINDTCGHVAGDELLRQLGILLPTKVRKRDTLARLGGDEFGVLMEHCTLRQARRVANALLGAVQNFQFLWEDKSFNIGVSIGLVPISADSKSITELLSAADSACYEAKDAGRNRVHVYHEEDEELAKRHREMQWVARINRALEENRFHLDFQSIKPLRGRNGRRMYYELLLRMEDEEGRVVLPGAFLPAAERYNLATRLDRWVVGTALGWLTRHPDHVKRLSVCSINLSGRSLGDEDFLKYVVEQFERNSVPPSSICFEITETAAVANLSSATHFIAELKRLGCQFALDDFGSGLSSFAYLKNLPVDYLKIDGVFVKDIIHNPIDEAMVKSINEIGQVMNKRTIAEFVESESVLRRLRKIGVDYAQGFAISRPRPIERLERGERRSVA